MSAHRRGFHLHLSQTAGQAQVRWSITRTLWARGTAVRSGTLASGKIELTAEGGTPGEVALALLRAALVDAERVLRQDGD